MNGLAEIDLMAPVAAADLIPSLGHGPVLGVDKHGEPTTALVDPLSIRQPTPADVDVLDRAYSRLFDWAEERMENCIQPICPHVHTWFEGLDGVRLYLRQITMPSGSIIASAIHMTEHPFIISKGRCIVASPDGSRVELCAPYQGRTLPGTRRMLLVIDETVWTTIHQTRQDSVDAVMREIAVHPKSLLGPEGGCDHGS